MVGMVLDGIDAVKAAAGAHLGYSDWLELTQERVDRFAEATGAPERATDDSGTAAEPFLVLALSNFFLPQVLEVRGVSVGVNYGCESIRFLQPVPVGARLRAEAVLTSVVDIPDGVQTTTTISVEILGATGPACVVESVSRYIS
jgi:acyl dehydratase